MTTISLGKFGDERRQAAGVLLHARLMENSAPGISVRRLGLGRAGRDVLVIHGTTVARSSGGGGLYLHVAIEVDAAMALCWGWCMRASWPAKKSDVDYAQRARCENLVALREGVGVEIQGGAAARRRDKKGQVECRLV